MSVYLPSWSRSACRVIERVWRTRNLRHRAGHLLLTMNSQHFHGMQYPYSYLSAGFLPPTGSPFYPPSSAFGYPADVRYQQQPFYGPQGNKLHQLNHQALYHQFLQSYSFSNSERFHPHTTQKQFERGAHRERRVRRSASSSDINYEAPVDILELKAKKLNLRGGSVESVATESSGSSQSLSSGKTGEDSPDYAESIPGDLDSCSADDEYSEGDSEEGNMHPRGVKRQPDQRGKSPTQKRPRSEERDAAPMSKGPWSIRQGILNKEEYQRISDAVLDFYEKKEQAQELYVKKMKLRDALYEVMKGVFPYCGLYVVGSSMNGFGSHTSDMDLCLMLSYNEIDQRKEATEILRILHKALRKCSFLKQLNLIRAKVPILKFVDKVSEVECDLNINNSVGIRNTHLLNAYSKLDWRVSVLVLFVKHWAKMQNINDASQGTVSSYSLVLMVIHFLQCGCNPPVIPSLQVKYPHKFDVSTDIRLLTLNEKLPPYNSPNKDTLGELFVGFMDYYANKFNFSEDAISVRLGRRIPREVVIKQNPMLNPPSQWKCISIEEPFNLSNTARSVFDPFVFQHIRQVFRKSNAVLRQEGDVSKIVSQPL